MKIQDITEQALLDHPQIKAVDFEHEWYFVAQDIDRVFMGAFADLPGVPLPILIHNERKLTRCVRFADIKEKATKLSGLSDFEVRINTALNFNPKRNH